MLFTLQGAVSFRAGTRSLPSVKECECVNVRLSGADKQACVLSDPSQDK